MSDSFKKAKIFLSQQAEAESIFVKVKQLEELNQQIMPYIDAAIRDYCQIGNLVDGRLILIVANGSIGTQLRYQTADLLKKFKENLSLSHINDIQCKVRPPLAPFATKSRKRTKNMSLLSAETADIVREIAETIEDPKLKAVMQKIAERKKK